MCSKEQFNTGKEVEMHFNQPLIVDRIKEFHSYVPPVDKRPKRCRAIIFNPDGTKVLGIGRIRPGREPYVVYPGGGLEEYDLTAKSGIWRELAEELGLTSADVLLSDNVIELDDEFFYLGTALSEVKGLTIGGPEAESDGATGEYLPGWFEIDSLVERNTFPVEVSQIIVDANRQYL